MRNRELIYKKLESLEHTLITLQHIVNTREPIKNYKYNIDKAQNIAEDIRSMIEREPHSHNEQNYI